MRKILKGQQGYLRYQKIRTGIAMAFGFLLIVLIFFTGIFIYADRKNLFTVGAIIIALPTAKMAVYFLMYPGKGLATKEQADELQQTGGNIPILCDMLITPEKKTIEFVYTAVTKSHIIIYTPDNRLDSNYHGAFIKNFLKGSDINTDVSFYNDYGKFKKRLASLKVNEPEEYSQEEKEHIENVCHNLKILSI